MNKVIPPSWPQIIALSFPAAIFITLGVLRLVYDPLTRIQIVGECISIAFTAVIPVLLWFVCFAVRTGNAVDQEVPGENS
ncbi:hypothetical protein C0V97_12545 [Asaia sp. W19]|nr:hypothetical protein C0V97_12545 [Asaia sp. W19]